MPTNSRQLALDALRFIHKRGAYADMAVDKILSKNLDLGSSDRRLFTELVYGIVRRQRSLNALIDKFARKPATQQPPDLLMALQIGSYQIVYLDQVPDSAAVNTTVELAKQNKMSGLAGLVNAILRNISRAKEKDSLWATIVDGELIDRELNLNGVEQKEIKEEIAFDVSISKSELTDSQTNKPPQTELVRSLGIMHSFPDWIVELWLAQFGLAATNQLCEWFNRSPHIDLRVNKLQIDRPQLLQALADRGIAAQALDYIPNAIRLSQGAGKISNLPGFELGWWVVQDASAQLAGFLLDPQPQETIIDACAAPGGKTTHLAELMDNRGKIWAIDRAASRLKKVKQNCDRLQVTNVQTRAIDLREIEDWQDYGDRLLLDVPCSGLGTLHRHADARWRQSPEQIVELAQLQQELITKAATWVKPNGIMVYSTCTLHPAENEAIVTKFLAEHSHWQLEPPEQNNPAYSFITEQGWIKVLPHLHDMDGFFMARLRRVK
ncbi:sun protein [Thalassoporum mexicanum PCC 7367]|uniref:16S rRNA (cytosine(967)-C(5))-methyltransferase n=1 Tax=Thalassoporum mexicanum TaxID=3457544 RepID=UPI00029FDE63|nr:16S rRNA (cytosine(967)-C(5))-methyltransferase [Pseudanabaena sp. PCC 7367]AFY71757.1 sun protein [Pseudanabaena sp. PCC 7367]